MRKAMLVLLISVLIAVPVLAATAAEYAAAGKAALDKNENEKAVELFEKAIQLEPRNAQHHYYLGTAYGELAQNANVLRQASLAKKTKAEFEKAVELDPKLMNARFALISYYLIAPGFMGGGADKALVQAGEIRKLDALEGHRAYARVYMNQKKKELAQKEYVEAVREQPKNAKAHYYLGNFYLNEKNWAAALHEYDMAIELDAAFMPAYLGVARHAGRAEQNYVRGEESARKYLAYKPTDEEPGHAAAWYALGQIQEKQGRKADARASYQNALKLAPGDKTVTEALKRVS